VSIARRARLSNATSVLPAAKKVGVGKKPPLRTRVGHAQPRHQLGVGQVEHGVLHVRIAAQQALDVAEGRPFDDHQRGLRDVTRRQLRQ
jgi:hypothetical protein